jgi:hypothetical protein
VVTPPDLLLLLLGVLQLNNVCNYFVALPLKTTSARRLYNNLDILEARKLIEKHSGEHSVPKIIDIFRNMQGTIEEQIFHNRRTLQDIKEIRKDDINNGVIYFFCFPIRYQ